MLLLSNWLNLRRVRREPLLMNDTLGDVLTIEELSAYLKISTSTLYKLVREARVPSQKVGCHWRFRKEAIDRWLEETWTNGAKSEEEG